MRPALPALWRFAFATWALLPIVGVSAFAAVSVERLRLWWACVGLYKPAGFT